MYEYFDWLESSYSFWDFQNSKTWDLYTNW